MAGDSEAGRKEFEAWARDYFHGITLYEFERKVDGRGEYKWEPMMYAFDAYRAGVESQREEGWISCAERLPEFGGTYLVSVPSAGNAPAGRQGGALGCKCVHDGREMCEHCGLIEQVKDALSPLREELRSQTWEAAHQQECRLKVEAALAASERRVEELREALEKLELYNRDIAAGRINYRPKDHIAVAESVLKRQEG
jgi:hypothetical protein